MKAYLYEKYGGPEVLELRDVEKPVAGDNEILIKIYATTVSSADWRARSLEMPAGFGLIGRLIFGIFSPRNPILGMELAGIIEAVGKDVTKFRIGDEVFADTGTGLGGHAEYKTMPEDGPIALKPAKLGFEQAAALCFGGSTALYFLRDRGNIQNGEKVLINGASGTTGTACVQLARHFGAQVTGICSTGNLELVKSIGAHKVIDYTCEDFTKNGETYDIIVDTAGTAPWLRAKRALNETGRLLLILGGLKDMLAAPFISRKRGRKIIAGAAFANSDDLRFLADLAEAGKFLPVIDRVYPFEEMIEAHRHVDTGHKKGSVVISIDHEDASLDHKP